jgi:thiamine-monophosphate kinase
MPLLEMGRRWPTRCRDDGRVGRPADRLGALCSASGCGAEVDLDSLPLSRAFIAERGQGRPARLFAATGGDDYALLAALAAGIDLLSLSLPQAPILTCIGRLVAGSGLDLSDRDGRAVAGDPRL